MKFLHRIFTENTVFIFFVLIAFLLFGCTPVIKKTVVSESPKIRILLNSIEKKDSLSFDNDYFLKSEEAQYEFGKQNRHIYIVPSQNGFLVYNQYRYLEYQKTKVVKFKAVTDQSQFVYHNRSYSGDLIFDQAEDSTILIINELPLEEYLRGVVPAEIYASDPENFEAVKAQAICARTYAIRKINRSKAKSFDVYSDTRDQVYAGISAYNRNADKAIAETRGLVLTFENQIAQVFYHSTCGGQLEPVENVFSSQPVKYLSGSMDAVGDVISCSASPKFRWVENRTIDQLDSMFFLNTAKHFLPENKEINDTTLVKVSLDILSRNSSGRVNELKFATPDTSLILKNFQIRRFLADTSGNPLSSNLFYFSQVNDSTITINGGGFGHGVGMCQWGAMNMSKRGFKYYHIINKYFPGTLLSKGY